MTYRHRQEPSGKRRQGRGQRGQVNGAKPRGAWGDARGEHTALCTTRPHDPSNPLFSKDWNNYPLVQISRKDGQPHLFGVSVKVNPRSENHQSGPIIRVGGRKHHRAREGPLCVILIHSLASRAVGSVGRMGTPTPTLPTSFEPWLRHLQAPIPQGELTWGEFLSAK